MNMKWKEYQLRLDGYNRSKVEEWKKFRLIAYQVYASTPMKSKPVNIEKYLPLGTEVKKSSLTEEMRKRIILEQKRIKEKWQMS